MISHQLVKIVNVIHKIRLLSCHLMCVAEIEMHAHESLIFCSHSTKIILQNMYSFHNSGAENQALCQCHEAIQAHVIL